MLIVCIFSLIYFSDDRNLDVFRQKVEAATQMQAVMGGDPRPNCLVIDEIDGAPAVSLMSSSFSTHDF